MSTLLAAIVVPALVCLSGVGAATWLGLRAGSAAWTLASSALLGICICGIVGPAASIVGLPVPATTLAVQIALALAGAMSLWSRGLRAPAITRMEAIALAAMCGVVVCVGLNVAQRPVLGGDEVYAWGYKAAMIHTSGRITPADWTDVGIRAPSYPFALPVAGSAAALVAGHLCGHVLRILALLVFCGFVAALSEAAKLTVPRALRFAFVFGIAALPVVQFEAPFFMADILLALGLLVAAVSIVRHPGSAETALWIALLPLIKIDGVSMSGLLFLVNFAASPRGERARCAAASVAFAALAILPWALLYVAQGFNPFVVQDRGVTARVFGIREALEMPGAYASRVGVAALGVLSSYVPHLSAFRWDHDAIRTALPFVGLLLVFVGIPWLRAEQAPRASRLVRLFAGLAILGGQFAGIASTPYTVSVLVTVVGGRAAIHIIPGMLLIASAMKRKGTF
jgi:hypothetical protein